MLFVYNKCSASADSYYGSQELTGPMVYIKTYTFNNFYEQYRVLLTMAPRNSSAKSWSQGVARVVIPIEILPAWFLPQYLGRSDLRHPMTTVFSQAALGEAWVPWNARPRRHR